MRDDAAMTLEEVRIERFAEGLAYMCPDDDQKPGWSVERLACRGIPASEVRRRLGVLFGQGRAVPFIHEGEIRWRVPTIDESRML